MPAQRAAPDMTSSRVGSARAPCAPCATNTSVTRKSVPRMTGPLDCWALLVGHAAPAGNSPSCLDLVRLAHRHAAILEHLDKEYADFFRPNPVDVIGRSNVVLVPDIEHRALVGQIGHDRFRILRPRGTIGQHHVHDALS